MQSGGWPAWQTMVAVFQKRTSRLFHPGVNPADQTPPSKHHETAAMAGKVGDARQWVDHVVACVDVVARPYAVADDRPVRVAMETAIQLLLACGLGSHAYAGGQGDAMIDQSVQVMSLVIT